MGKSVDRPRIAIDGTPFFRKMNGIGRYAVNLVEEMANANPRHHFVILGFIDDRTKPSLLPELPNVEYYFIPLPRRLYQALFSRLVALPLDWLVPYSVSTILHVNFTCYPYLRRPRRAVVYHDAAYLDVPETVEKGNLRFLQRRVGWSIKRTNRAIFISHATKSRFAEYFKEIPEELILPPKVDKQFKRSIPVAWRHKIQEKHQLPDRYILSVATLEPRKNLSSLVTAYSKLPSALKKTYPLVIVGAKGWDAPLASTEHVYVCGYVDDEDLPALYQSASLLVFPSLYEGFGLPVAEAIASEIPVLTSRIPPIEEFAGNCVRYSEPDVSSLTQALIDTLTSHPEPHPDAKSTLDTYYKSHPSSKLYYYLTQKM